MKKNISNICENLYSYCLKNIPQIQNNEIMWILNGSILCNVLANVETIDGEIIPSELHNLFEELVRTPKGDIDICYKPVMPYKFDLEADAVKEFYNVSDEQRTYNFVDSNDELSEEDLKQLCFYKTKNGLEFYAKKPQFVFLYKFKEFVAMFHSEIMSNDYQRIIEKRKNILNDVKTLYKISCEYIGENQTYNLLIDNLYNISAYMHEIYNYDRVEYSKVIDSAIQMILVKSKTL